MKPYEVSISPEKVHDILENAQMDVGCTVSQSNEKSVDSRYEELGLNEVNLGQLQEFFHGDMRLSKEVKEHRKAHVLKFYGRSMLQWKLSCDRSYNRTEVWQDLHNFQTNHKSWDTTWNKTNAH